MLWRYNPADGTPADGLNGVYLKSIGPDSQRYFNELTVPDELRMDGQPAESLAASLRLIPLLRYVAIDWPGEKFGITSIPPIECGCLMAAILCDESALSAIGKTVDALPELDPWKETVAEGYANMELVGLIRTHLQVHPGAVQASLGRKISNDGRQIAHLIYYMEQAKQIRRERNGRSYDLYLLTV